MGIVACAIVWNEEMLLPGCLESLVGQVDQVVVVDGAYEAFPHDVPWSTDGTEQVARAYGARWVEPPERGTVPWLSEIEKRNASLEAAREVGGEWALVIDADERLVGALPRLERGAFYALEAFEGRPAWRNWSVRVFELAGARYEGAHCAAWQEGRLLRPGEGVQVEPGACRLMHLAALRTEERKWAKAAYYLELGRAEEAYRREHGL